MVRVVADLRENLFAKWRLSAEAEPREGGVVAYRRRLLLLLAVCNFYSVALLLSWIPAPRGPIPLGFAVVAGGMLLSALTLRLRQKWPTLSSWLFLLGSMAEYTAVLLVFDRPALLPTFVIPVLAAGLLLGVVADLVILAAAIVVVNWLRSNTGWMEAGIFWLVYLTCACALGVLTGRALKLIDYWERELVTRQERLVTQLRERQGHLNRSLKALDEAYDRLKRANDELVAARRQAEEARALKEQFVANVSHELRTPLNLIMGFAEVMYFSPESYAGVVWTPTLRGDVNEIYLAGRHLQSLVNDVLDLERIDAASLPMYREWHDIRTIITEAFETVAPLLKQRGLTHRVEWAEDLPRVFVDRTRIRQVMLNLLNNAIKYTEEGEITIRAGLAGDAVVVNVCDTGIGIPPDQLEHIFERFHQINGGLQGRGGVGLGLALSRQFVELHGGRMWAESQVGLGSTFSFALPLPGALPQTTPLLRTADRLGEDAQCAPVVVVDPDPEIANMLGRYLENRPVLSARDVAEAEALVASMHPWAVIVNQPPDAPAESWLGPLSQVGLHCDVPILRCSIPSPSWLWLSSGFDDCLVKPVSLVGLRCLLEKHHVGRGSKILVADDDPGFVRLMVRMLGTIDREIRVLPAYSGAQAIRLAHEHIPHLVLLDLKMPEPDGFAVVQALRTEPALQSTPVVAVTVTSYGEDAFERQGGVFTLSRSTAISPGILVELLKACLGIVRPDYVGNTLSSA